MVTIDGVDLTGTQVHALELVGALVRHGGVRVRVRISREIGESARAALEAPAVEACFTPDDGDELELDDVVHAPSQAARSLDVQRLQRVGRRVVLTQQNLIAYGNPIYFEDYGQWRAYREHTRQALKDADRVTFPSHYVADEARRENLVDERRADVVHIGTDHRLLGGGAPREPAHPGLSETPFLVCIGTDLLHENRLFALEVFTTLRRNHNFRGRLVLAGPSASRGTSRAAEDDWRALHPAEATSIVDLGVVVEAEKAWLYAHAALMLYPTVQEGFGLVPFEAADAGLATLWAAHTSLAELLPVEAAGIVPWDAAATAARAAQLLADPSERERLVAAARQAGERLRWDRTAAEIVDVYRRAAAALPPAAAAGTEELADAITRPRLRMPLLALLRSRYRALYHARRRSLRAG
jgi:glycosyltransferase involved in cell wall biosynthesis